MTSQKVILITGASRGIGHAIATHLLHHPSLPHLLLVSRSLAPLEAFQRQAGERQAGGSSRVEIVAGDLADEGVAQRAVDTAMEKWGRLDGMVLNHGQVEPVGKVVDASVEGWRRGFEVNVFSCVAMIKAAIPALRKTSGRIIMTSSGAAVKATATWGCYGAGKAVLNHLAKTVAKEEPEITVLCIRPGVVDTEMQVQIAETHFKVMEEEDAERFRRLKTEGKMLRPEQPGNVMARLVLGAPRELSGEFLNYRSFRIEEMNNWGRQSEFNLDRAVSGRMLEFRFE